MLSQQQIDHYQQQGYLLVGGIFSDNELCDMEREFDGIVDRRMASPSSMVTGWQGEWKAKLPPMKIIHTHDLQAFSAQWTRVLVHDRFTEAMADLIGPNVQLHHCKLFQKPPENGSAFPMHQDYPYFPHEKHSMMAVVIHLTDATEQMGCLRVVPGSHKHEPLPIHKDAGGEDQNAYLDPSQYPIEQGQTCPAQRGEVLFFSYLTIHGSGINLSEKVRKTVLVQVRDPTDRPTQDVHRSHSQGMMLRGINPIAHGNAAPGTLEDPNQNEVDPRQ